MIARNLTIGKPVPDFKHDTVNVTVTWLPPINQAGLTGFICFPIAFNHFQSNLRAFAKHTVTDNFYCQPFKANLLFSLFCVKKSKPGLAYFLFLTYWR